MMYYKLQIVKSHAHVVLLEVFLMSDVTVNCPKSMHGLLYHFHLAA